MNFLFFLILNLACYVDILNIVVDIVIYLFIFSIFSSAFVN